MKTEEQLEQDSRVADAELGVAEELGYGIAALVIALVLVTADSWILALVAGGVAYWISTLRYRRRAAAAEDAYYRVAKLGKYVEPSE